MTALLQLPGQKTKQNTLTVASHAFKLNDILASGKGGDHLPQLFPEQ